jgi:hypothetical protein
MHVRERLSASERDGNRRTESSALGFVGESCGAWRWGQREGDSRWLLEASSDASIELLKILKHFKIEAKGTRVDCQITYEREKWDDRWPFEIERVLRAAERARGVEKGIACDLKNRPKTGNTLELFTRVNRRFIRHYDKAAEQRYTIAPGTFRAEVEYKREMARAMYKKLLNATEQRWVALDAMTAEWRRLGIEPNYSWEGQAIDLSITRRPADQIVTARWLIDVAAPAFRRLTDDHLKADVLEAFFKDAPPHLEIAQTVREKPQLSPPAPVPEKTPEQAAKLAAARARIKAAHAADKLARLEAEAERANDEVERRIGM